MKKILSIIKGHICSYKKKGKNNKLIRIFVYSLNIDLGLDIDIDIYTITKK